MIKERFVFYKTYNKFKEDLDNGLIGDKHIAFIKDIKVIWTHGEMFGSDLNLQSIINWVDEKIELSEEDIQRWIREQEYLTSKNIKTITLNGETISLVGTGTININLALGTPVLSLTLQITANNKVTKYTNTDNLITITCKVSKNGSVVTPDTLTVYKNNQPCDIISKQTTETSSIITLLVNDYGTSNIRVVVTYNGESKDASVEIKRLLPIYYGFDQTDNLNTERLIEHTQILTSVKLNDVTVQNTLEGNHFFIAVANNILNGHNIKVATDENFSFPVLMIVADSNDQWTLFKSSDAFVLGIITFWIKEV